MCLKPTINLYKVRQKPLPTKHFLIKAYKYLHMVHLIITRHSIIHSYIFITMFCKGKQNVCKAKQNMCKAKQNMCKTKSVALSYSPPGRRRRPMHKKSLILREIFLSYLKLFYTIEDSYLCNQFWIYMC